MLQERLIAEGLLTVDSFQQAVDHQKKFGCALEDSLIALRLVAERDVLRALAREYRLQYLSLEKVAQLRVESELLEKVPVRLAESTGVVPFRFDVDDVLWVITRGPLSADDREKIRVRSEARQVNALLARSSVVAAAIRRHYYSDHDAFEAVSNLKPRPPAERVVAARLPGEHPRAGRSDPEDAQDIITLSKELKCPACGSPASLDDFQCGNCLLLLNPEAGGSDPKIEGSGVVRALLSIPESRPFLKIPDPPPRDISSDATRMFPAPLDKKLVPRLVAGMDLALKPMHQFEAYVASHIDGEHSIEELIQLARLPRAELNALLHTFRERGIIELQAPRPPPLPAAPPAPPPAPAPPPLPGAVAHAPTPVPAHPPPPAVVPPPPPGVTAPTPPPMLIPPAGAARPDRRTPLGTPPTPRPPPPAHPRTPAQGSPPASPATPVPTPFPAGQAPGFRVLSRTEAQKVVDRAPQAPATPAVQVQGPPKKASEADNILATAVGMERRGDVAGAIYVLKRGIAQLPRPGPLYNKLALILIHQRRDYRQAEELLNKALALEPENEVYQKNLYKVVTMAALQSQGIAGGGDDDDDDA